MSVTGSIAAELEHALTGAEGLGFCEYLRKLYYTELERGHVSAGATTDDVRRRDLAIAMGLMQPRGNGEFRLTDVGYEVANFAKEYANWIDAGRKLPNGVTPPIVSGKRVLDAGCSFGRHLAGFARHGASAFGVDLQHRYLQLSRAFAAREHIPAPRLLRGRVEQLPFRDQSFDVVFCRLVLNYVTDVNGTINEFARVLTRGGVLVLVVDRLPATLRGLLAHSWIGNERAIGFTLFGLVNTLVLQSTGRQMVLRRPGRMHAQQSPTWPTRRWLRRRLGAYGFVALEESQPARHEPTAVFQYQLAERP